MEKTKYTMKSRILKAVAVMIGRVFYDPKYLKGQFFGPGMTRGWYWVLRCFFMQKIVGINRDVPFPATFTSKIPNWKGIRFDPDSMNLFQKSGCYFQAVEGATITIGRHCEIANNVGIITANHDIYDINAHAGGQDVILGDYCWVGINAVILPGVVLGPHTVVGAGSIVNKSFPEGYCVLAGSPARVIKTLRPEQCRENMEERSK